MSICLGISASSSGAAKERHPKQMGASLALPECNVPPRFLIGIDNAKAVLQRCATHRVAYVWGILAVVTLGLLIAAIVTADNAADKLKVPWWVILLPIAIGLLYSVMSLRDLDGTYDTEVISHKLSGMSKKDFLNYRVGDDRTARSAAAGATSAGVLAGSNLLGPFLRADR
jgi:hypothetical protein